VLGLYHRICLSASLVFSSRGKWDITNRFSLFQVWSACSWSFGLKLLCPEVTLHPHLYIYIGRAIAQVVSCQLPTAAAPVRAQVRSCGICGGQSGIGAVFLRVLRFPLPILIPLTAPHSSSIIRGWYQVDSASPHPKKLKKTMLISRTEPCAQMKLENFRYHTNDVLYCAVQKGLQFYFCGSFTNRDGF
jgi:hypothetical protein